MSHSSSSNSRSAPREESELDRALRLNPRGLDTRYGAGLGASILGLRERVGADRLREAAEIHRIFSRHPLLRAIWQPKILSGEVELCDVLAAIAPGR